MTPEKTHWSLLFVNIIVNHFVISFDLVCRRSDSTIRIYAGIGPAKFQWRPKYETSYIRLMTYQPANLLVRLFRRTRDLHGIHTCGACGLTVWNCYCCHATIICQCDACHHRREIGTK